MSIFLSIFFIHQCFLSPSMYFFLSLPHTNTSTTLFYLLVVAPAKIYLRLISSSVVCWDRDGERERIRETRRERVGEREREREREREKVGRREGEYGKLYTSSLSPSFPSSSLFPSLSPLLSPPPPVSLLPSLRNSRYWAADYLTMVWT